MSLDFDNITFNPYEYREFLRETLIQRCKSNPLYSLRSFARDLNIDNSALSKILSGKRTLGPTLMKRFSKEIGLTPLELRRVEKRESDQITNYEQLAIDSFAIISDWQHYALLELLRVDDFKVSRKNLSKALGISSLECDQIIERLIRVELLEVDSEGTLIDISGGKSTNISNNMKHNALRKMQKQLLNKAIECIDNTPYELRNNTSMTMAIDTEKIPEAIEEITLFRRKLAQLLSRGEKRNDVYNLSIALHPLTTNHMRDI